MSDVVSDVYERSARVAPVSVLSTNFGFPLICLSLHFCGHANRATYGDTGDKKRNKRTHLDRCRRAGRLRLQRPEPAELHEGMLNLKKIKRHFVRI